MDQSLTSAFLAKMNLPRQSYIGCAILLFTCIYLSTVEVVSLPSEEYVYQVRALDAKKCSCDDNKLCLPIAMTHRNESQRQEVFAFSVTHNDQWKHYDWDQLTTVAWNEDPELLCHAHSRGVKVVILHNFNNASQVCDPARRREWILDTKRRILDTHTDGVNIDTETAMQGQDAECLATLVRELRAELQDHELTAGAQITFDVPWAPRGVDDRYYRWQELANASDFLFVMSYDMRSQIYYQCIAAANSPLALVKQGLEEYIYGNFVDPSKLVVGLPWYGYRYNCTSYSSVNEICTIQQEEFHGAPCSDAAGDQIFYSKIQDIIRDQDIDVKWDNLTKSPYFAYEDDDKQTYQFFFDNPESLSVKYALAKDLGLRGVGMWNADLVDYTGTYANETKAMWDSMKQGA